MRQSDNAEQDVYALLENLEIASACACCGRLSFSVLGGGACPRCHDVEAVPEH